MDQFLAEILTQPQVLEGILEKSQDLAAPLAELSELLRNRAYDRLIFTGMGSSLFALIPVSLFLLRQGIWATFLETSELVHYAAPAITGGTILIVASQSGETVEVTRLVQNGPRPGVLVGLTNNPDSTLGRHSQLVFNLSAGEERSVATKTYVSTLLIAHLLGRVLGAQESWRESLDGVRDLPRVVDGVLSTREAWLPPLVEVMDVPEHLYLLARGPSLATAMTGALLLKEASRTHAEGMSAAQFRHGPLEMVAPGIGIVVFAPPGPTQALGYRLAQELAGYGARVAVITGEGSVDLGRGVHQLCFPLVDFHLSPLVEILPIQLLSWNLGFLKGLIPGEFQRMAKITRVE